MNAQPEGYRQTLRNASNSFSKADLLRGAALIAIYPLAAGLGAAHGTLLGHRRLRSLEANADAGRQTRLRLWRNRATAALAGGAAAATGKRAYTEGVNGAIESDLAGTFYGDWHSHASNLLAERHPAGLPDTVSDQVLFDVTYASLLRDAEFDQAAQFAAASLDNGNNIREHVRTAVGHSKRAKAWYAAGLGASFVAGQQAAKAHVVAKGMRKIAKLNRRASD